MPDDLTPIKWTVLLFLLLLYLCLGGEHVSSVLVVVFFACISLHMI